MLFKVSYRHGPKKAVVAENLESLIDKDRHIFNDIVCTWLIVLKWKYWKNHSGMLALDLSLLFANESWKNHSGMHVLLTQSILLFCYENQLHVLEFKI